MNESMYRYSRKEIKNKIKMFELLATEMTKSKDLHIVSMFSQWNKILVNLIEEKYE